MTRGVGGSMQQCNGSAARSDAATVRRLFAHGIFFLGGLLRYCKGSQYCEVAMAAADADLRAAVLRNQHSDDYIVQCDNIQV